LAAPQPLLNFGKTSDHQAGLAFILGDSIRFLISVL